MMSSSHLVSLASAAALALAPCRARAASSSSKGPLGAMERHALAQGPGRLADASAPLHVLGGYDILTLEQWVEQVSLLCGQAPERTVLA